MKSRAFIASLVVMVALTAPAPRPARAQAPASDPWVGKWVVLKEDRRLRARPGSQAALRFEFHIYRVEKTRGTRLRLVSRSGDDQGWIAAEAVVPLEKAFAYYNKAIRSHPTARDYWKRGRLWMSALHPGQAIADFDEAIRLDPRCAEAFSARGYARGVRQDLDGAVADYTEAIRLAPEHADSYTYRGYFRSQQGQLDQAIEDFDQAIRLDPESADAYSGRGQAWASKQDWEGHRRLHRGAASQARVRGGPLPPRRGMGQQAGP